ncbi:hypothetical protein KDA_23150 [Dictyobacter alpinus]|uniref:Yip1 domain-containing protein n=1 Tax=Dictyobacter alpinus TaxID=2014873 RepID=A0A402B645_9CHLR|nr:YIP1 family protein [Dictyobacter alpinus]GCE26831.1 hypothetical protein KDA_23150 [Dictyobacter alpinus]
MRWNSEQTHVAAAGSPGRVPHHPLRTLPFFYAKVLAWPSPTTFARAAEYARWNLVWLQLGILILIPVVLGLIKSLVRDTSSGIDSRANPIFSLLGTITVGATIGAFILKIILIPLLFLLESGLQYLLARAFRGNGHFVQHAFDMLLYLVPLSFIGGLIITVFVYFHISTLFFAPLISLVVFCYGVFLNIFVVQGVHNLNRDKAIATVAIPYILGLLIVCGSLLSLAHYLSTTISNLH